MVLDRVEFEERVPAKGCNGDYEVSRKGEIFNAKTGRKLKLRFNLRGYLLFDDYCNGVHKAKAVAVIVAKSFNIPNPDKKPTVNHKNGIKTDNRPENLEWYTRKEQVAHARDVLGVKSYFQKGQPKPEGSGKPTRSVRGTHMKTGEQREFESISEAARLVGGHVGNICKACQGKQKSSYGYRWEYLDV